MKRWMPVLCIALLATSLLGASAWEGSAMMSAYGEFPDSGYYAACNSFPRNTAVEVVNLENGKSVTVIVTKGLDNPGIFLLLSPEAAKALSLEPGSLSRVRVSAPRNIAQTPPPGSGPGGDPDFNPSLLASRAAPGAPAEEPRTEEPVAAPPAEAAPAPAEPPAREPEPADTAPPPTAVVTAEVAPKAPAEVSGVPAQPAAPEPALPPAPASGALNAKEAPVVRPELIARPGIAPQETGPVAAVLPAPETAAPREVPEDRAVVHGLNRPVPAALPVEAALVDPALVPDELPETALTRRAWPEDPAPSVALADLEIRMDDSGKPEALTRNQTETPDSERVPEVGLAEPVAVAKAEPATAEPAKEPEPVPAAPAADSVPVEPKDVVVTMEPAAPKPPEAPVKPPVPPSAPVAAAPVPAKPTLPPKEPPSAPDSTALLPGRHYIQVGAYKTTAAVETAAARLRGAFPVTIDTVTTGPGPLYRLFVGPLGRDETGVALLQVRSLGFKEAFLKN